MRETEKAVCGGQKRLRWRPVRYLSHLGFARTTSPIGLGASCECDNDDDDVVTRTGISAYKRAKSRDDRPRGFLCKAEPQTMKSRTKWRTSRPEAQIYTSQRNSTEGGTPLLHRPWQVRFPGRSRPRLRSHFVRCDPERPPTLKINQPQKRHLHKLQSPRLDVLSALHWAPRSPRAREIAVQPPSTVAHRHYYSCYPRGSLTLPPSAIG